MNKIKLLIINCKAEINSLLDRVKGKELTHIIVTKKGDRLKCYGSVEMMFGEDLMTVAKCLTGLRVKLLTIRSDNIEYITEKYSNETWNTLIGISDYSNDDNINHDDRLYG